MKKPTKPNPQAKPNDTDEMREAIERLTSEGINFSRPTQYQLKISDVSFYPDTGRIFQDRERTAWEQRGLYTLVSHIRGLKQPNTKVVRLALVDTRDRPPGLDLSALGLADN